MHNYGSKFKPAGHYSITGNIIFALIFFILTLFFYLDISISAISKNIKIIHSSEIIGTYNADSGDFTYQGKPYSLVIYLRPQCNEKKCSKVDINESTIVLNERNTMKSRLGSDLVLMLIFPVVMLGNIILLCIRYCLNIRRKNKIQDYLNNDTSIETIVVDITSHHRKKQRTTYNYICQNPQTGETHTSESYYDSSAPVGSRVRGYDLAGKYGGMKYIDMDNILPPDNESLAITEKYKEIKHIEIREKIRGTWKGETIQLQQKIVLIIIIIFTTIFSIGMLKMGVIGILFCLPCYGVLGFFGYFFIQDRHKKDIIKNGVPRIGTITSIHKHGFFKAVPFGYLSERESNKSYATIDKSIGDTSMLYMEYGYSYSFTVSMDGVEYTSEKFSTPFPKKGKVGGKIYIYFKDTSMKKYAVDEDSVDVLN